MSFPLESVQPLRKYKIELVRTQPRLDELWIPGGVQWLVERCLTEAAYGELDAADVYQLLKAGKAFLFVETCNGSVTIAFVIEYVNYPKYVAANFVAICGTDLEGLRDRCWEQIQTWAKFAGVTSFEARVSAGMRKMLESKLKFKQVYHHMRFDLGD